MSISHWRIYTELEVRSSRGSVGKIGKICRRGSKRFVIEDFSTLQSMLRLRDCAGDLLED